MRHYAKLSLAVVVNASKIKPYRANGRVGYPHFDSGCKSLYDLISLVTLSVCKPVRQSYFRVLLKGGSSEGSETKGICEL